MGASLNEAVACAADEIADGPVDVSQGGTEVADKYPAWVRLCILAVATVLAWAVVVSIVMAFIGD